MRFVRDPRLGILSRHARPSAVKGRRDVPLLDSHVKYVERGRVPVQGGAGPVAAEEDLPDGLRRTEPFLDLAETALVKKYIL